MVHGVDHPDAKIGKAIIEIKGKIAECLEKCKFFWVFKSLPKDALVAFEAGVMVEGSETDRTPYIRYLELLQWMNL